MLFRRSAKSKSGIARNDATIVTVVGAFRSGTNYLKALLEQNHRCEVRFNTYGWKHGFIPVVSEFADYGFEIEHGVFVTKSPLSYLSSLHAYHSEIGRNMTAPKGWHEFLRSPLTIYIEIAPDSPEYRFASPVDYWNALNWNHLSVARKAPGFVHCKYESLIAGDEARVAELAARWGLVRNKGEFIRPEKKMQRMSDAPDAKKRYESDQSFEPEHYLSRAYLDRFAPDDVEFVANRVDPEVLHLLGYDPVEIEARR